MTTPSSLNHLTSDNCDYLLSLPNSELKAWLMKFPRDRQTDILRQLSQHHTPTERATASLYEFAKQAWSVIEPRPFVDNWHIGAICEHLQAVTTGQIMKLLINIPPGCSKSILVGVMWFCWEWAISPSTTWMYSSYDQKLSTRDSVKCRALITSPWYQTRWPITLTGDQNQKTYYENDRRGYRLATTPGGHGTGEHPQRICVDDPHNVEQAESANERDSVIQWWDLTMATRGAALEARRVIIMQRLHERDLSGHVLDHGGWEHICLPMRYEPDRMKATSIGWTDPRTEPGELLTPLYRPEVLQEVEKSLGPYGIAGQMQQRPAPRSGGFFKTEKIRFVDAIPAGTKRFVRAWDKGATEGGGDPTAGVLMAEHDGIFYVIDVVHGQWGSGRRDDNIDLTAALDETTYGQHVEIILEQEPGSGGKQSAEISVSRLRGYRVHATPASGNKEVRADQLASQMEVGNVCVVKAKWNRAFIDELIMFPNGTHDDQVDAASMAFNRLAKPRKKVMVA